MFSFLKKFTDVISLKNWQVETEAGWEDISSINKTIPYRKYTIETESGKTLDCADNHIIMDKDGNQVFAKDSLGIEVKTKDGPEKITSVVDTGIEEEMFDLTLPEGSTHCYYTNEILSHNTTLLTIFALWYTTFQDDKTVLIVANKEEIALEILNRIRLAYEELPIWLKPGVKEYQKQSIVFLNGSKIKISATSTSAGRGLSINCLIVDECAIIDPFKSSEFFKSVLPTISSSKQAKILLTSTPKGTNNFFYRVIREAMTGKSAWKYMSVPWNMIPYRDEEWKQTAISDCGGDMQLFRQEYCCEFIEEGDSAIDKAVLDAMHMETYEPQVLNTNEYKVWHMPDPNHVYSIGVDVSDGVGGCASCIQVTDITNLREIHQVACYNNRYIDPAHFAIELYEIACQWGRPWILCERNSMGCETIATLEREPFFYPRLVSYDGKDKIDYSKHGIMSSTNVKFDGISNLRYYMNVLKVLKIPDADTMAEFDTFIKYPNGTYKKASGANIFDDRVMALVWSLFILWIPIAESCLCVLETDTAGKPLKVEKTYDDSGKDLYNLVGGMIPPDPKPTRQAPIFGGYIPYSADFNEDNMTMSDLIGAGWSPL